MNTLVRYTNPLSSMLDEVLNTSVFNRADRQIQNRSWPNVDISEHEDHYELKADLPGAEKKDINVSIEKGTLTIKGEKKEEKTDKKEGRYYHFERKYGSFERSFYLPDNINDENIDANFNNGVLTLKLSKKEESKPKSIEIKID